MAKSKYMDDVRKQIAKKGYAITMRTGKPKKKTLAQKAKAGRARVIDDQERKALNMKPRKRK